MKNKGARGSKMLKIILISIITSYITSKLYDYFHKK